MLRVSADLLLFDKEERGPDADLKLQFEAISRLDRDGKKVVKSVLESILIKHDAKRWLSAFTPRCSPTGSAEEAGVITNSLKKVHPNRIATSFVFGSQRLFDFIDDNPFVEFYPCDHTNDTSVIRKIDSMVAINSAIEVDLTGQICADSIGYKVFSGIGGQMDFIRGAALSNGGKPIIALPSTAKSGSLSRIVPSLKEGAGVVTTRGHIHWVVTEYGAVNLFGKTLRERAELLISISHPDFRGELRKFAADIRHFVL